MKKLPIALPLMAVLAAPVQADAAPEDIVGGTAIATGTAAAVGIGGAKALGLYTITTAGGVAVGSTLAGSSAAGTLGILAGTSGTALATTVGIVTGPIGWSILGVSAAVASGVAGYKIWRNNSKDEG